MGVCTDGAHGGGETGVLITFLHPWMTPCTVTDLVCCFILKRERGRHRDSSEFTSQESNVAPDVFVYLEQLPDRWGNGIHMRIWRDTHMYWKHPYDQIIWIGHACQVQCACVSSWPLYFRINHTHQWHKKSADSAQTCSTQCRRRKLSKLWRGFLWISEANGLEIECLKSWLPTQLLLFWFRCRCWPLSLCRPTSSSRCSPWSCTFWTSLPDTCSAYSILQRWWQSL